MDFNFGLTDRTLKMLLIIPVSLLIVSAIFLSIGIIQHGSIVQKSIDLAGGVQITLHYTEKVNLNDLERTLEQSLSTQDIEVRTTTDPATRQQETIVVSVGGSQQEEKVVSVVSSYLNTGFAPTEYSVKSLGPALAGTFWSQARWAFTFAAIFMMLAVFFHFRVLRPSLIVILAVGADIFVILGFMSFFGIRLSLATIAAILMIFGYGVDSNILLSNRVLKGSEGTPLDRWRGAMKTGLTMSATTMSALAALYLVANSPVLKEIATILLIGLGADLVNTWFLNASLILWKLKEN